ncbi:hypothetical protein ACJ73_00083 [Blastomyces percursus]|uniref:Uncharacterized protein n=1 Tax=Blastomyces percursus TaxID=1658174 RepID=A0A1J9RJ13_9EURO|nr:hypothetical protein ACJ73_00083 [Blastomyces percursus]
MWKIRGLCKQQRPSLHRNLKTQNKERKVMKQQLEEHNDGESAAASIHYADQNARMTWHLMLGPQTTAADLRSDTGSWRKMRDREFTPLKARQAALEKERRNQQ